MDKNEDRFARRLFGDNAQTGTAWLLFYIAGFTLLGGAFFWWVGWP